MELLTQNSKLKKTSKQLNKRVFNFGISAYKTSTGKTVCPFADACVKYCYAKKGAYSWSNVKPAFEKRYNITRQDNFASLMVEQVKRKKADYIRIHDSGDFYSKKYLNKWLSIAEQLPNVKFYAYTKSHDFFRGLQLPENFDIIFSEGSKLDSKLNKEKERHASIFKTETELKKAGYTDASKLDLYATKFFTTNNKIGLIYH
tara:strand:- start:326 stop:931 length:606 start_codon:yes stop_codon:yes gene_type:complete